MLTVPLRYIPFGLPKKERKQQAKMLKKSRKLYKQQKYYTRKALPSFKHKVSKHILHLFSFKTPILLGKINKKICIHEKSRRITYRGSHIKWAF